MSKVLVNYIDRDIFLKLNSLRSRKKKILSSIVLNFSIIVNSKYEYINFLEQLLFFEDLVGKLFLFKVKNTSKNLKDKKVKIILKVSLKKKDLYNFLFFFINILNVSYQKKYGKNKLKLGLGNCINLLKFEDKNFIYKINRNLLLSSDVGIIMNLNNVDKFEKKYIVSSINLDLYNKK